MQGKINMDLGGKRITPMLSFQFVFSSEPVLTEKIHQKDMPRTGVHILSDGAYRVTLRNEFR